MQLSSNRGLLIRYFHHFGLSLHYINNSIRKFAAEIKTYGNPVIQALPIFLKENWKLVQAKNNLPSPISVIITGNRRHYGWYENAGYKGMNTSPKRIKN